MRGIAKSSFDDGKSALNDMLNKYFPVENIATADASSVKSDQEILMTPKTKKPKFNYHPELSKFLSSNSELVGVEFWKSHQRDYPSLFLIYCQLKSIQATSASIERVFSFAKLVFDDLSSKMDEETILSNLVMKYNS